MWKIFIYPFWHFRMVEKYLEGMERKGFRLEKVYLLYLFKFKTSPSKEVQYTYSRSFLKDHEMHYYEYELRKNDNAETIPIWGSSSISIHRICKHDVDLNSFVEKRRRYMGRLIINRSVFILILLLGSISATIAYNHGFLFLASFLFLLLTYHLVGYIQLCCKTGDGSVVS